jgi:hypothetical protein
MGKGNVLFVDTVTNPPYVILKTKQTDGSFKRSTVNVNKKFQDKQLADPVKNYLNWSQHPTTYGQTPAPSSDATSVAAAQLPAPEPVPPRVSIRDAKKSIDKADQQPTGNS